MSGARRRSRWRFGWCSARGSCSTRPTGCRTSTSPPGWIVRLTVSVVDERGSAPSGWRVLRIKRGRDDRAVFPPQEVAEVKAIACELPRSHELPLSRFSRVELHRLVIERGVTEASASTIWRWLHEHAIKPWQTRSWIFPRDPDFAAKAGRALDLYDRGQDGRNGHDVHRPRQDRLDRRRHAHRHDQGQHPRDAWPELCDGRHHDLPGRRPRHDRRDRERRRQGSRDGRGRDRQRADRPRQILLDKPR